LRRKTDFLIKPVFLTFFSEKANKYVKTPHFRAEFSVPHLSSTHSVRRLQFGYFALESLYRNGLQISGKKYSQFF